MKQDPKYPFMSFIFQLSIDIIWIDLDSIYIYICMYHIIIYIMIYIYI